jgi:hypothetical protein
MFSHGQVERMDATLAGPRASLLASAGLGPPPDAQAAARDAGLLALAPLHRRFDGVTWK